MIVEKTPKIMNKVFMVYIDFDNTLYEHPYCWTAEEDFEYNLLFGFGKLKFEEKYLNQELLKKLEQLVTYNREHGIKTRVNLLTGCKTSVFYNAKLEFISDNIPFVFDNYFMVSSQEDKISMIEANNNHISSDGYNIINTLVVDDNWEVTGKCQHLGYDGITPGYFEKHYTIGGN